MVCTETASLTSPILSLLESWLSMKSHVRLTRSSFSPAIDPDLSITAVKETVDRFVVSSTT